MQNEQMEISQEIAGANHGTFYHKRKREESKDFEFMK